jgi:hypothetical protein
MTEPQPSAPEGPPAAPPGRTGRGALAAAAVVGAIVGAAVVGIVWLAVGDDDSAADDAPDTAALEAPATLGGYQTLETASAAVDGDSDAAARLAERTTAWNARTAEAVSQAYGGAAAFAATYANEGLDIIVPLIAVRASSPRPFAPYTDAETLGLARSPQEVRTFGEVSCVVQNRATPAGQEPDADATLATTCVRTGDDLTVQVLYPGPDLGTQPEAVARLVDEAWAALAPAADGDDG